MSYRYVGYGRGEVRKFDGKNYYRQRAIHERRREAEAHADDLRRRGYLARVGPFRVRGRITRWTTIYRIYARREI